MFEKVYQKVHQTQEALQKALLSIKITKKVRYIGWRSKVPQHDRL